MSGRGKSYNYKRGPVPHERSTAPVARTSQPENDPWQAHRAASTATSGSPSPRPRTGTSPARTARTTGSWSRTLGLGYRHVVTPDEVRERLSQLPSKFLRPLEVVQFSRITRKKQSFPCYGMQWGPALYLYPIEKDLVEHYNQPPKPSQLNEARMYGGRWIRESGGWWTLVWTEAAIKDFYLNNILIHELGHLLDDRNSRTIDRERYAEWFAVQHGYQPTQSERRRNKKPVVRRHHGQH